MLSRAKKIICSLLALAVLLAPLEFAFAHNMTMTSQTQKQAMKQIMVHNHADAGMDHHSMEMDLSGSECDGQGACNDCVYCSPVLNVGSYLQLDKPDTPQPVAAAFPHYSIDLPVDIRPPRQL